jgi:hypothetical protein
VNGTTTSKPPPGFPQEQPGLGSIPTLPYGIQAPPQEPHPPKRRKSRVGPFVALGFVLFIALGIFGLANRNSARKQEVAKVVKTFIQARNAKNGALACAQLTAGAQRDMVALVTRVPASAANAADCPTYIVRESPLSRFTRDDLQAFGDGEADVSVGKVKVNGKEGDWIARAHPKGSREPDLPAWYRDGQWKLDGFASIGSGVVLGCESSGQEKLFCQCIFDVLREQNPGSPNQLFAQLQRLQADIRAGGSQASLQQAGLRCKAYAGRA